MAEVSSGGLPGITSRGTPPDYRHRNYQDYQPCSLIPRCAPNGLADANAAVRQASPRSDDGVLTNPYLGLTHEVINSLALISPFPFHPKSPGIPFPTRGGLSPQAPAAPTALRAPTSGRSLSLLGHRSRSAVRGAVPAPGPLTSSVWPPGRDCTSAREDSSSPIAHSY